MGWNFAQSNLYGFSTSGAIVEGGSVFSFQQSGNSLLTGGKFGPEGGLITTALLVLGICALLIARKRRSRTGQIS